MLAISALIELDDISYCIVWYSTHGVSRDKSSVLWILLVINCDFYISFVRHTTAELLDGLQCYNYYLCVSCVGKAGIVLASSVCVYVCLWIENWKKLLIRDW